jgi:hypothetical protein
MKNFKIGGLAVLGVLALALVYPGIPLGASMESNISARHAVVHCHYLHWTGLRARDIDVSHMIRNGSISMGNKACYEWASWDPMK